jgi:serine/threonine protein kinase
VGGFGVVFKYKDIKSNKEVGVKQIRLREESEMKEIDVMKEFKDD